MSSSVPLKEAEPLTPTPIGGTDGVAVVGPPVPVESEAASCPPKKLSESEFVIIPSYSRWFNWHKIHECEARSLPEFFDGSSNFKTPSLYKYLRNSIIKKFRANPSVKITFTEVRKTLVGDVGSIRRVFDFLETWGLINYSPSAKQQQTLVPRSSENKEVTPSKPIDSPVESASSERTKKFCSGCKSMCSIACFVCDRYDLVLCARCYVRGNYRVGLNSSEFRRVEIAENVKTNWTEKETLHLLEALTHHGDNWVRVAEHVGGRTEKDCVARFVKLPFGEQYANLSDEVEEEKLSQMRDLTESTMERSPKKARLTPLADASNPIMAQAVFLSALAGTEAAEAAAAAAVAAVYEADDRKGSGEGKTVPVVVGDQVKAEEAELLLKDENDVENTITNIIEVQMEEFRQKIDRYEEKELQLEKEWRQLNQMRDQLYSDQLVLLFHKDKMAADKSGDESGMGETTRAV